MPAGGPASDPRRFGGSLADTVERLVREGREEEARLLYEEALRTRSHRALCALAARRTRAVQTLWPPEGVQAVGVVERLGQGGGVPPSERSEVLRAMRRAADLAESGHEAASASAAASRRFGEAISAANAEAASAQAAARAAVALALAWAVEVAVAGAAGCAWAAAAAQGHVAAAVARCAGDDVGRRIMSWRAAAGELEATPPARAEW